MNRIILFMACALFSVTAGAQCTLLIEPTGPGSGCFNTFEELLFSDESEVSFVNQTLTKTSTSNSWNSGAFSYNKVFVNGSAYTVVEANDTQRAFGLSEQNSGADPSNIDYAFRLRPNGIVQIFEFGTVVANPGAYNIGDTLRIKNDNGSVKYYRNSEMVYESAVAPPSELYVDLALRTPDSSLSGLGIENVSDGNFQAVNFFDLGFFNFFTWTLNGDLVGSDQALALGDFEDGDELICEVFAFAFGCFGFTNSNAIILRKPSTDPFSFYIEGIYDAGSNAMASEEVVWRDASLENVVADGNDLLKVQNTGWNGNAASYNTVKEGGYFEFVATETNERRIAGLSNTDANAGFTSIEYAFFLRQNGNLRIYENGVNRGSFGNYSSGSVLRIEVAGGFVRYYHNGELLRTTALTSSLPLLADVSIRDVGGTISDAVVVNRNSGGFAATATGAGSDPGYQWMVNGTPEGADAPAFSSSSLEPNDLVTCALDFDFLYCDPASVTSNTVRYLGVDNNTSWIGVVDSDWDRIANWSNGVPNEFISAEIPAGTPNDPLVNVSAVVRDLSISAGAELGFVASNSLRVCGNLSNRGAFNAGSGTVSFSNTGNKVVSGDPITFNRLIVNAASAADSVLLETDIRVGDETVFIRGVIFTQAQEVVYLNGAGSREGLSTSHIDGTCRKIGANAFRFPIGQSGTYAPITISAPSQATDVFTARYFGTDPEAAGYPQSSQDGNAATISRCEYWMLNRVNGNSVVSVTLSYEDERSCEINDPSELLVMRWDGSQWNSHGYLTHTGNTSSGTVTSGLPILNFSPFTLGSGSSINPLPIELGFFDASIQDQVVLLEWATYSELNNAFFTLERSSDGVSFESIGQIAGQGNASSLTNYSFTDDSPLSGGAYYRLVQTDFDGTTEVFPMRYVYLEMESRIRIYPNPSSGLITVDFSGRAGRRSIRITTLEGRPVFETFTEEASAPIDLGAVSKGVYIIEVSDGVHSERFKQVVH